MQVPRVRNRNIVISSPAKIWPEISNIASNITSTGPCRPRSVCTYVCTKSYVAFLIKSHVALRSAVRIQKGLGMGTEVAGETGAATKPQPKPGGCASRRRVRRAQPSSSPVRSSCFLQRLTAGTLMSWQEQMPAAAFIKDVVESAATPQGV